MEGLARVCVCALFLAVCICMVLFVFYNDERGRVLGKSKAFPCLDTYDFWFRPVSLLRCK